MHTRHSRLPLLLLSVGLGLVASAGEAFAQDNPLRPLSQPSLELVQEMQSASLYSLFDSTGWAHGFRYGNAEARRMSDGVGLIFNSVHHVTGDTKHTVMAGLDPDGVTVTVAVRYDQVTADGNIGHWYRYVAEDLYDTFGSRISGDMLPNTKIREEDWGEGGFGFLSSVRPDGALCPSNSIALGCWELGNEAVFDILVTPEALDAALTTFGIAEQVSWDFSAPLFTPSNDVFFVAESNTLNVIGQLTPTGSLRIRRVEELSLPWEQLYVSGLAPPPLAYDAERDLVLVPRRKMDYLNWYRRNRCGGGGISGPIPMRWRGLGLQVFEVEGEGLGYVSLTDAMVRHLDCVRNHGFLFGCFNERVEFQALHGGGGMGLRFVNNAEDAAIREPVYRVRLLETLTDFDEDGLRSDEERAVGSSDFARDTDGGGVIDTIEVQRGSDPVNTADDGVPEVPDALEDQTRYAHSQLIFLLKPWLPAPQDEVHRLEVTRGPYCHLGACYAPDGTVVTRVPSAFMEATDGSHVAYLEGGQLHRTFHVDGSTETLDTSIVEASNLLTGATFAPVDRALTYVVSGDSTRPEVFVLRQDDDDLRIDALTTLCELGLGACDDAEVPGHNYGEESCGGSTQGFTATGELPTYDLREARNDGAYEDTVRVLGVDPETRELLIVLIGNYQHHVLAISPEGQVTRRFTQRDLLDLGSTATYVTDPRPVEERDRTNIDPRPLSHLIATGHGDFLNLSNTLIIGAPDQDAGVIQIASVTGAESLKPIGAVGAVPTVSTIRVWDDTILGDQYSSTDGDEYEWVRYTYGWDPGDVLIVHRDEVVGTGENVMAFDRSGPRGGFHPLSHGAVSVDATGVDVAPDGSVCLAGFGLLLSDSEAPHNFVVRFDPTGRPIWTPESIVMGYAFDGTLMDCAFDPQSGELVVLEYLVDAATMASTTTLWRFPDGEQEPIADQTWEGSGAPNRLAFTPQGHASVEPFATEGGLVAVAYEATGQRLSLYPDPTTGDVSLRRDGEEFALIRGIDTGGAEEVNAGTPELVVRADGVIVASIGRVVFAIHPESGEYALLGTYGDAFEYAPTPLLAVYPGTFDDPWTMTAPNTRPENKGPEEVEGMSGAEQNSGEADEDCGCHIRSIPSRHTLPVAWLLLGFCGALMGSLRRRR